MLRFATVILCGTLCGITLLAQAPNTIQTIAGTGAASFGGDGGKATLASLNVAVDVFADRNGNLFIADQFNHRIREIAPGGVITTVAGTGTPGFSGDGGPAVNAQINTPTGICTDNAGNIYIADVGNQRIRKVDTSGTITTLAGNGTKGYGGDGGLAINASFYNAVRVAIDTSGNVLVADQSNHRVRRITPGGIITTIAGNGVGTPATGAFSGDGGAAVNASLNNPTAVAVDTAGVIYIADQFNQRIRKVTTDGKISTVAGTGTAGFGGDGGPATAANLNYPGSITVDVSGNLYFNDDANYRTRRIAASSGAITTIAGNGVQGFSGDGASATTASLNGNFGITIDTAGNVYIADSTNNRIREIFGAAAAGAAPTITVNGVVPIYSTATTIEMGSWVSIYGTNLASAPTSWNGDFPTTLGSTSVTINGKPAYIWYVSPSQINVQAPNDTFTGKVNVVVTTASGNATGSVTLGNFGPSFSVVGGKYVAGIILRFDGSGSNSDGAGGTYDFLGPNGNFLGYKTVAAKAGDNVVLFGVGFGPTNPVVQSGKVYVGSAPVNSSVALSINSKAVIPSYTGITSAGLYQMNIVIPTGLGTGDVPIVATAGGIQTPSTVVIPLQ